MDVDILKAGEKAILALRSLYRSNGYLPFRMTKFEEYDLYVRNKDFLVSDSIITFNGTDGKLLALKPDVTLSIIKNFKDDSSGVEKVYYNENVYRLSSGTGEYREIPQTGIECIGSVGEYETAEVITLAAESLCALGDDWVLDISHMGIVSSFLEESCADVKAVAEIMRCLKEKNMHELESVCKKFSVNSEYIDKFVSLCEIYGDMSSVLAKLGKICTSKKSADALSKLGALCDVLSLMPYSNHIRLDFSIVNDMNYYNGFVFRGYLQGIPEGVLSGGQYDGLMEKFGKKSGGIGFAVYLDLIEDYRTATQDYDTDIVLLYGENEPASDIMKAAENIRKDGKRVFVCKNIPSKQTYRSVLIYEGGTVKEYDR